jgi:hypothetical protein
MAWVKLDDSFDDHPKLLGCSGDVGWTWTRALAWANKNETDGHLPPHALDRVAAHVHTRKRAGVAVDLVKRGTWHVFGHECPDCEQPEEGGWVIHDFLIYQPSAKRRAADRERSRQRMGKTRDKLRSRDVAPQRPGGVAGGVAGAPSRPVPARPVPSPPLGSPKGDPSSSSSHAEPARDDEEDDDGMPDGEPPRATPAAVTLAQASNGSSLREVALADVEEPPDGWTHRAWTLAALRAGSAWSVTGADPPAWAVDFAGFAGVVLAEHLAEGAERDVSATEVAELRAMCERQPAPDVFAALDAAIARPKVADPIAYARKCLAERPR